MRNCGASHPLIFMNIQRFLWAATTLLFAFFGWIFGGWLGYAYVSRLASDVKNQAGVALIEPTVTLGMTVVAARLGWVLFERFVNPSLKHLSKLSAAYKVLGITGALSGLIFGLIVTAPLDNNPQIVVLKFFVMLVCAAFGMAIFGGMRGDMLRVLPQLETENASVSGGGAKPKFLDTNIIIDGRLGDLVETGFIEGPIYIPQFVLEEVQHIADSSDGIRRARGRRGLDVLNAMKELTETKFEARRARQRALWLHHHQRFQLEQSRRTARRGSSESQRAFAGD